MNQDNEYFEEDKEKIEKRRAEAIRHLKRLQRGFRKVLESDDATYVFNYILESTGLFIPTNEISPEVLGYKAGQRDVGLMLWNGLVGSDPEFVIKIMKFREELKNGTE